MRYYFRLKTLQMFNQVYNKSTASYERHRETLRVNFEACLFYTVIHEFQPHFRETLECAYITLSMQIWKIPKSE